MTWKRKAVDNVKKIPIWVHIFLVLVLLAEMLFGFTLLTAKIWNTGIVTLFLKAFAIVNLEIAMFIASVHMYIRFTQAFPIPMRGDRKFKVGFGSIIRGILVTFLVLVHFSAIFYDIRLPIQVSGWAYITLLAFAVWMHMVLILLILDLIFYIMWAVRKCRGNGSLYKLSTFVAQYRLFEVLLSIGVSLLFVGYGLYRTLTPPTIVNEHMETMTLTDQMVNGEPALKELAEEDEDYLLYKEEIAQEEALKSHPPEEFFFEDNEKLRSGATLNIALLSDIHIGPSVGKNRIVNIVEWTNNLEPDIIAISGDLADGFVSSLGGAAEPICRLKSKYGVYFATGNHEYFHGNVDEWFEFLENCNITVLHNENKRFRTTEGDMVCMAGMDDLVTLSMDMPGHHMDPVKALKGCQLNDLVVLLAHQPNAAWKVLQDQKVNGNIDLIMSGHTHNGQVNFLWPSTEVMNKWNHGLHENKPTHTQVIVSAGVNFFGPPVRTVGVCEIVNMQIEGRGTPDTSLFEKLHNIVPTELPTH
ncbi:unnamed protein product, partial [Mesorhabditis spiculigera]